MRARWSSMYVAGAWRASSCVVKIQRTALKRLVRADHRTNAAISRALMDEGFVGTGEFLSVGNGDSDGEYAWLCECEISCRKAGHCRLERSP